MSGQHTPGATVYNRDGRKLHYRRDLGDGTSIVSRWLATEGWDGEVEEYISDEPLIVMSAGLFRAPPTEVLAGEVADLNERLADARKELLFIQHQTREAEVERTRAIDALTAIEPLRNIERFIAGEITHFVVMNESYEGELYGGVAIETFEKAITQFTERGRADGMKLLSLFGDSRGALTFRINHYGEGSGSWRQVIPCLSEEEAHAKAAEVLETMWAMYRGGVQTYRRDTAIQSAKQLGFAIPADILTAHEAKVREGLEANVLKAREALAKAEEALLSQARGEA